MHVFQKVTAQVVSHFDNGGIFGNVFMSQSYSDNYNKLSAQFEGLEDVEYLWTIYFRLSSKSPYT